MTGLVTQLEEARNGSAALWSILNPADLEEASKNVFSQQTHSRRILEKFTFKQFCYQRIWPLNATAEVKAAAEKHEFQIHTDLNVLVAIPSTVCKTSKKVRVTPWVRWHGGGGMTGYPLTEQWLLQADYTFMLEAGNIISIEPTYSLMPESSGEDMQNNVRQFSQWIESKLELALQSINPTLSIDWSHMTIFGESFGAYLAVYFWITIKQFHAWPKLRIAGLVLRAPLADTYKRDPGAYCGVFVPMERATRDCQAVFDILKNLPFIIPRSSTKPPGGMYGAYAFSVSHLWGEMWRAGTMLEMIEAAPRCPDLGTVVYITHGTSDIHVPYASSVRLRELLENKWPNLEVHLIPQENKGHAWDYEEPLHRDYRQLLASLCND